MNHYWTNEDLPSNLKKIETTILGNKYSFLTDNGVFSKSGIDFGTRVLLESIPIANFKEPILDVGCGYGVIGITIAKETKQRVTMCDVNKRALHLSKMNAEKNNVSVEIIESDAYQNIDGKFNVIVTNPPIRAGKKVVYDIVMNAKNYLETDGQLYIVIRKEQGAKSMIRDLEEIYKVSIINKEKSFFIIKCEIN